MERSGTIYTCGIMERSEIITNNLLRLQAVYKIV